MRSTPIFVISFNKSEQLLKSIASYRALDQPVDIIVHDNGSDNPRTLETLSDLETHGEVKVYRSGKVTTANELVSVQTTITSYFAGRRETNYIITDPDVELAHTKPDLIQIMELLLEENDDVICVGPMLTIRDIPDSYPLRQWALQRHIEQFWNKRPEKVHCKFGNLFVQRCRIDTTFAMYRAGHHFDRRPNIGIRIYEPYEAKHLDWYGPDSDSGYYAANTTAVSHWNNNAEFETKANYQREPSTIFTVSGGEIVEQTI